MFYLFLVPTNMDHKVDVVNTTYPEYLPEQWRIFRLCRDPILTDFWADIFPVFATSDIIIVTLPLQLSVCRGLECWLFLFTSVDIGSLPDRAVSQWVCTPACRWWEWLPSQKCEEFFVQRCQASVGTHQTEVSEICEEADCTICPECPVEPKCLLDFKKWSFSLNPESYIRKVNHEWFTVFPHEMRSHHSSTQQVNFLPVCCGFY